MQADADTTLQTIAIILNMMGIFSLILILAYTVWGGEEEEE
jgi:hypothetical protein